MPYAQPPVNNLRLAAPLSLNTTWKGTRDATEYSPICIGYPSGGANDDAGFELSEDCLTLNVVRPTGVAEGSNVPVMLWIYGGGFVMGGSADHRYNGTWIVQRSVEMKQPIIFASFNYRVGPFGFLYSQEIKDEHSGNFGLLDQNLAIQWVHENIGAFGGDNTKVTIMGESAGAESVAMHLLAFGQTSTNLFRGGIMESGTATTGSFPSLNETQQSYDTVVESTGCASSKDTLACLRSVSVETFITATNVSNLGFGPVVDGLFITQRPSLSLASGKMIKVPLLLGQNTDEGASFGTSGLNTVAELEHVLLNQFTNASLTTLLELYPDDPTIGCPYNTGDGLRSSGSQDKRSLSISGDVVMHGPRRLLASTMANLSQNVFTYRFDQVPDNVTIEDGTEHFMEVAYVFSNPLPTQNPLSKRKGDQELATQMTSYWVSFVVNQDPNHSMVDGAITWPNYRETQQNIVFRRQGSFVEDDNYRAAGISFINSLGAELER
ncbi:alpha/beta-hydrolase [Rhodocollybia butyracea]|uniref:Carboxylic ester hydrolase n=1 Tax=Rhodocollybia butyracea TaxID=206335 RepID=A0A9P5P0A7_9AGAR|nr:alpha/beta-hydrolase [Rhodocollybia butyracea]KAF9049435.1 alpha/beta-hydrolase [Rhodocollybia butyracea]